LYPALQAPDHVFFLRVGKKVALNVSCVVSGFVYTYTESDFGIVPAGMLVSSEGVASLASLTMK
jgi:hypothetical protein